MITKDVLFEYGRLRVAAETYYETQRARVAIENRLKAGARRNGILEYEIALLDPITQAETDAEKSMLEIYRGTASPEVQAWVDGHRGLGDKLVARLLGHLGHPRYATPWHWEGTGTKRVLVADKPFERTVADLWSYCGHGDPTRKKAKGMTVEEAMSLGNPVCKMIVWNIAKAIVMAGWAKDSQGTDENQSGTANEGGIGVHIENGQTGDGTHNTTAVADQIGIGTQTTSADKNPLWGQIHGKHKYRFIYEQRKVATVGRTHAVECVRCGPSGKPALIASPWSDGHRNADAMRIVGKEVLRDLWIVSEVV